MLIQKHFKFQNGQNRSSAVIPDRQQYRGSIVNAIPSDRGFFFFCSLPKSSTQTYMLSFPFFSRRPTPRPPPPSRRHAKPIDQPTSQHPRFCSKLTETNSTCRQSRRYSWNNSNKLEGANNCCTGLTSAVKLSDIL